MIRKINRDFQYIKMRRLNLFISSDYLIFSRNKASICGILLIIISKANKELLNIKYLNIMSTHYKNDIEINFYKHTDDNNHETWIRFEERGCEYIKGVNKIENKIRDWIVLFLKEAREEWEESILNEKLEERNWSMLNNIKNKMLEYRKNDENE